MRKYQSKIILYHSHYFVSLSPCCTIPMYNPTEDLDFSMSLIFLLRAKNKSQKYTGISMNIKRSHCHLSKHSVCSRYSWRGEAKMDTETETCDDRDSSIRREHECGVGLASSWRGETETGDIRDIAFWCCMVLLKGWMYRCEWCES